MEQRQRVLMIGAGVGALLVAAAGWWLTRPTEPAAVTQPAAPVAAAPAPAASPASSTGAAAPAAAPSATAPAASAGVRARVQQRLDAIARAYEQGDARAMERALWPNHAVIRPDGERFDRRGLLALWADEWEAFSNRELRFYVEDVIEDAGKATVVWTILLTADLTDANGDAHHMMVNGKQQATIVGTGESERLEGPIEYTTFERKLDGNVWPLD